MAKQYRIGLLLKHWMLLKYSVFQNMGYSYNT